jgi:hypothetical protein
MNYKPSGGSASALPKGQKEGKIELRQAAIFNSK